MEGSPLPDDLLVTLRAVAAGRAAQGSTTGAVARRLRSDPESAGLSARTLLRALERRGHLRSARTDGGALRWMVTSTGLAQLDHRKHTS